MAQGNLDSSGGDVARRGRRTKLTDETAKSVSAGIAAGVPAKYAAQRAGIDESTFHLWMRKGRKTKKGPFFQFFQSVKKAEADAVARNVAIIQKAASESWTAAAWWLERRHHAEFGRKDRTILQTTRKGPDLGEEVRERLREAESGGPRQPGQAGGTGTPDVADTAPPAAHQ